MINKRSIIITDIGSTTTKAILFQKERDNYKLIDLQNRPTTVERPVEDVKIGIYNAIKELESKVSQKILSDDSSPEYLKFLEDSMYLTTSSAGGGLQILVIGLTLFDSASSAERAAYGAGGVILDTFAVDDHRSAVEKMQLMKILHPDIILFSGGIDGGAISGIFRLGEILTLSHPKPKFGEKEKIPLVYAGNKDAQSFIKTLFSKQFDLHIVPNIRPTMKDENLQPSRDKIHQLFMDNVMEQAPGYQEVKQFVSDDIIPTPMGVIKALQLVSRQLNENVMALDIGGATTDIFSNILGQYYRTVSANYGMSYSISNVMADCGFDKIKQWLPDDMDENYIRNYISNKMLYPTYIPKDDYQLAIEHAVAREAIRMAKEHHMKMHFNTEQIGILDKIKTRNLDKFAETFYVEKMIEKRKFHNKDINIMIGAGGVISNAEKVEQSLISIIDGLNPQGITEIWRDNHFISPHIGKLSDVDEKLATELLMKECYEKIALVIRPIYKKMKIEQDVMSISIKNDVEKRYTIKANEVKYIPNEQRKESQVVIELEKGFYLLDDSHKISLTSDLPILIDTRMKEELSFTKLNNELGLYNLENRQLNLNDCFADFFEKKDIDTGIHTLTISLPYEGDIFVDEGDKIQPDTLIGENRYDPARIYVLSLFTDEKLELTPDSLRKSILVKNGDEIKFGQKIIEIESRGIIDEIKGKYHTYHSPVRGRIEDINFSAGTIIIREIQDYSTKPIVVDVAKKLGVHPKHIKGHLKKELNDFVYAGEGLASKLIQGRAVIISAPSTGTIKEIDIEKGTVTIQYDKKPYQKFAGIRGKVVKVEENISASIEYEGSNLSGIIGFGSSASGDILFFKENMDLDEKTCCDKIVVYPEKIDYHILKQSADIKVKGIIASSIDNKDLVKFIDSEIGVALTGDEKIPYPIIITEGFGDFKMDERYVEFFKKSEGKLAYINGHTQIRAGVTRPRIIVM
ncbi:MAG: hypothetical protein DRH57_04465 [Candidatus Cloacimonadota bacterium]|nr:MAG: hypothetical protein DRH57_04465 [Candidatus Cloacimonadota bacterium]